jgi:hypothetical protein
LQALVQRLHSTPIRQERLCLPLKEKNAFLLSKASMGLTTSMEVAGIVFHLLSEMAQLTPVV